MKSLLNGMGAILPWNKKDVKKPISSKRNSEISRARINSLNERIEQVSNSDFFVFKARDLGDELPLLSYKEILFHWHKRENSFPHKNISAIITHYGLIIPQFQGSGEVSTYTFEASKHNGTNCVDLVKNKLYRYAGENYKVGAPEERPNYNSSFTPTCNAKFLEVSLQHPFQEILGNCQLINNEGIVNIRNLENKIYPFLENKLGPEFTTTIMSFDEALTIAHIIGNFNDKDSINRNNMLNYQKLGLPRYLLGKVQCGDPNHIKFGSVDLSSGEINSSPSKLDDVGLMAVKSRIYKTE